MKEALIPRGIHGSPEQRPPSTFICDIARSAHLQPIRITLPVQMGQPQGGTDSTIPW